MPTLLSAAFVPRLAVIAVGVPVVCDMSVWSVDATVRVALLGLLLVSVASLGLSPDPLAGFRDVIFLMFLCGAFIMGSSLDRIDGVMLGLGLGLGVSSLMCVPQWFGVSLVPQAAVPAGLFYNSEVLGEFSALILIWSLLRPVPLIAALALVPVLLCGSRVALVSLAVALFYAWRPGWRVLVGVTVACTAAAIVALVGTGDVKFHSAGLRGVIWGATAMAITPWGNGLGWFQAAHPSEQYAHSDVLQAMAELGVGSVFLFALAVIALMRQRGNHAERATFVGVCVQAAISFPLHLPASGFLAAVLAGYLACGGDRLCARERIGGTDDGAGVRWNPAAAGTADAGS